jgi:cytochrome c oxidase subunit IV
MSGAAHAPSAWPLWRRNLPIWAALLVLLGITFGAAYLPLGPFNVVVGLIIAAIKASLVGLLFMNLKRSGPLMRLAAAAGFFLLVILFALTLSDVLTRVSS